MVSDADQDPLNVCLNAVSDKMRAASAVLGRTYSTTEEITEALGVMRQCAGTLQELEAVAAARTSPGIRSPR